MINYLLTLSQKYYQILFAGWTCTILFLLLSEGIQENSFFSKIPHFDKVVHFSIFMIWSSLFSLSFYQYNLVFLALLIFFAIITEVLQQYVSSRSADVLDAIVDVLGGVLGYYLIKYLKKSQ